MAEPQDSRPSRHPTARRRRRTVAVGLTALALLTALVGCGGPQAAPRGGKAKPTSSARHPMGNPSKKPSSHPAGGMGGGKPGTHGRHAGSPSAASKGRQGAPKGHHHPGGAKPGRKGHGRGGAGSAKGAHPKTSPARAARTGPPPTTLPRLSDLRSWNPSLRYFHRLSRFIPGMGVHLGPPGPGLVLMTNGEGEATAVEANFPQRLGDRPWFDPATSEPNGGVAFYSEHLYFVPRARIQPGMPTGLRSDLTSWERLSAVNPRLRFYRRMPQTYRGLALYGPARGPGVLVLVRPAGAGGPGSVAGFLVEEPASWGWFPWYAQPKGQPVPSPTFGRAYYSVLYVAPPAGA